MTVKNYRVLSSGEFSGLNGYDAVVLSMGAPGPKGLGGDKLALGGDIQDSIQSFFLRTEGKGAAGDLLSFDMSPLQMFAVYFEGAEHSPFQELGDFRGVYEALAAAKPKSILVDLRNSTKPKAVLDALCSAVTVGGFKFPKYGAKPQEDRGISIDVLAEQAEGLQEIMDHSLLSAESSNLVRHLTMRAGNDLKPATYVNDVKEMAKDWGVDFEFIDFDKLMDMKAGAFVAVAQGSPDHDAGIVKLTYAGSDPKKHLCLVGKGITYDTGGTNLKPAGSMFGMEGDMAGSALALGLFKLAVKEKWTHKVSCYLAISDNSIGDEAYRPNDVVTSLKGKTIEVVHTDAEGRMVLADTLHLASQDKPDLMMDFATLTGACVGAIGTTYSGAFTNRDEFHSLIVEAGKRSGERAWTFPLDDDFGECLKSDIADIKQCRLKGGVDHIEAAYFLREFVSKDVPWIHMDLASSGNSGGLAHVPTDCTGFGVRLCSQIIKDYWQ